MKTNSLYCGQAAKVLGDTLEFPDESVDLIYMDPPFFSNRNYEVLWGDGYELRAFEAPGLSGDDLEFVDSPQELSGYREARPEPRRGLQLVTISSHQMMSIEVLLFESCADDSHLCQVRRRPECQSRR